MSEPEELVAKVALWKPPAGPLYEIAAVYAFQQCEICCYTMIFAYVHTKGDCLSFWNLQVFLFLFSHPQLSLEGLV